MLASVSIHLQISKVKSFSLLGVNEVTPKCRFLYFVSEYFIHAFLTHLKALRHLAILSFLPKKHELMGPLSCQTVSSVHNGWLPPCRPFVVKFCTAQSGTVCTVPALHGPGDGDCVPCILLTAHTLPPASVSSLQTYSPFVPLHLYPVAKQCPPHHVTMGTLELARTKYNFASANMMC